MHWILKSRLIGFDLYKNYFNINRLCRFEGVFLLKYI